jgi:drug/metabolite transporter (DMT)-like permease
MSSKSDREVILIILLAIFLYAITDGLVKWLSQRHAIGEIIFYRKLFTLLPVLVVVKQGGGFRSLRSTKCPLLLLRALLGIASMFLYFFAFSLMSLSDVIAIGMTAPLLLVVLSKFILSEHVSRNSWIAISLGFVGAMIVIQPSFAVFGLFSVVPLAGAVCLALYMLILRKLSASETAASLIFYVPVVGILCTGIALPWVGELPGWNDSALFAAMGVLGGLALHLRNLAYSSATSGTLAPFEYTGLIWIGLISIIAFGDTPTWHLAIGAAVLVAANAYLVWSHAKGKASLVAPTRVIEGNLRESA